MVVNILAGGPWEDPPQQAIGNTHAVVGNAGAAGAPVIKMAITQWSSSGLVMSATSCDGSSFTAFLTTSAGRKDMDDLRPDPPGEPPRGPGSPYSCFPYRVRLANLSPKPGEGEERHGTESKVAHFV